MRQPAALLLDRDGTLVHDVPYNGDPRVVHPIAGVADALQAARIAGVQIAVVTNQSGIGRGLITPAAAARVNRRLVQVIGPVDAVLMCPHHPDEHCACRKPRPGLVLAAAMRLGVAVDQCVVLGDRWSDIAAAEAAGARAVLVCNNAACARGRAPTTAEAIMALLGPPADPPRR